VLRNTAVKELASIFFIGIASSHLAVLSAIVIWKKSYNVHMHMADTAGWNGDGFNATAGCLVILALSQD
jgi:hypothetical protein